MQDAPAVSVDGYITIDASNKSQSRGPHGLFRYFGKLAPDVTGKVLDLALECAPDATGPVVDVMCGSGTTLLEAADRGLSSVGCDVNPVAKLYAEVKTRSVNKDRYSALLEHVSGVRVDPDRAERVFENTRNATRWFSDEARAVFGSLVLEVRELKPSRERDLLYAVLLGRARRISNASERTGRIFYDPESAKAPWQEFMDAAKAAVDEVPAQDIPCRVLARDGRQTSLPAGSTGIVFCHPPYFALYRYSSDVLRFELEIGGFQRRDVNRGEIREGWKSGDPRNLDGYVTDMGAIFAEANRLLSKSGCFALVASNSTLGDEQLPVIDRLAAEASARGLDLRRHYERKAHHGSASYHRSARSDKVIQQDHVLLFTPKS